MAVTSQAIAQSNDADKGIVVSFRVMMAFSLQKSITKGPRQSTVTRTTAGQWLLCPLSQVFK